MSTTAWGRLGFLRAMPPRLYPEFLLIRLRDIMTEVVIFISILATFDHEIMESTRLDVGNELCEIRPCKVLILTIRATVNDEVTYGPRSCRIPLVTFIS
jgi:hypothetical protein